MRKLVIDSPSTELVDAYICELAKGYGLPWGSHTAEDVGSGSDKVSIGTPPISSLTVFPVGQRTKGKRGRRATECGK
jgi:hypothetical protein